MTTNPKDTDDAVRYPDAWGGHVLDRPEPDLEMKMTDITTTKPYPKEDAWAYFMLHHDNIRSVCQEFLPRESMQIPNTRVAVQRGDGPETITDQRAAVKIGRGVAINQFDVAVVAKDADKLMKIMNDAWLRAPESRSVYGIAGFTEMCNLMDETVEGFCDNGSLDEGTPTNG